MSANQSIICRALIPLGILIAAPAVAAVSPYAHYRMGDGVPSTNGGNNLPYDSSSNGRHMSDSAGTPDISPSGGPNDDAYYTFSGIGEFYWGTEGTWDPPEENVGVEAWVRTSRLAQVNRHVFGTGDNTTGINLGYDATSGRGWFGSIASVALAGTRGTGSYAAGEWIHLAVVRSGGITTFYANGIESGNTTGVPANAAGSGELHMAVEGGGATSFNGGIAEARIFTFTPGSFDPETDLLVTPFTPELVREEIIATTHGTTYLARFQINPESGQNSVPHLRLEITGNTALKNISLVTPLPAGAAGVPYIVRFEADSTSTTLRFNTLDGDNATTGQIADLVVAEPITATPSAVPTAGQQAQIDRRYGLFLHFGINTFHNEEWTDGTKPVSSYQPTALNVEQWVQTAYEAGMRYVLLISKHHDGFCVWDSPWTNYDVGSTPVTTDILAAAAAACEKYGIKLALYYSIWDRHESSYPSDEAYNQYMFRQLSEILGNYGPVGELWLDGGWEKANTRWPSIEIYDLVRRLQPDCQVSCNWTIGSPSNPDQTFVLPTDQQNGYPIRYFPSDFRLGDPYSPAFPDPKHFDHNSDSYYLPFEATVTLSSQNKWFFDTGDLVNKSVDQLASLYYTSTAQDNILVLNAPPDRSGRVREIERSTLFQLRDKLGLSAGAPLPKNITGNATGTASAVWGNDTASYGPQHALDGNPETRWASGPSGLTNASFEIDFGANRSFDRILIDEFEDAPGLGRITAFQLQAWQDETWTTFHTGTTCGRFSLHDFPTQITGKVRLLIDSATDAPAIWEFQIHQAGHSFTSWRDQFFPAANTDPAYAWNGDPDHDLRINLIEFALDDNPTNPTPSGKTAVQTTNIDGENKYVFSFPSRSGTTFSGSAPLTGSADGIIYQVSGSTDLQSFTTPLEEVPPTETSSLPPLNAGWSYHSFLHTTPDPPAGFFRIGISSASE